MKLNLRSKEVTLAVGAEELHLRIRPLTAGEYQELIAYISDGEAFDMRAAVVQLLKHADGREMALRLLTGATLSHDAFDVEDDQGTRLGKLEDLFKGGEGLTRFFTLLGQLLNHSTLSEGEAKN